MLGDFGEVYVLDWGIAKLCHDADTKADSIKPSPNVDLTVPGKLAGTLPYMSPEQASGHTECLDATSDIYALGAILFELLTLERMRPLVPGPQLLLSIHEGRPQKPSQRAPRREVPPELDAICLRATMQDKRARYASARQLHTAIDHYLAGERDGALRKEAAARHMNAAATAVDRALSPGSTDDGARRTALQEIGRSLALEPTSGGALKLLLRVLTEPPRQLPIEAEALLKAEQAQRERVRLRALLYMGSATVFLLCMLLAMGTRDYKLMSAFIVLSLASITLRLYQHRHGSPSAGWQYASHLLNLMIFACYGRIMGPLLLMLLPLVIHGTMHALSPVRRHRRFVLWTSCAMVLFMTAAEQLGIIAPSYLFENGALIITPNLVRFTPTLTLMLLLGFGLFALILPVITIGQLPEQLHEAQRRLALQAWHFRQLIPELDDASAAATQMTDSRRE